MKAFDKGHVISKGDIGILRTEKVLTPGISPEYYDLVIGKTLSVSVENGAGVQFTDFFQSN